MVTFLTVGLEVHAELRTHTKMFCGCKNDPDADVPNTYVCPVCLAHPGALPVINKQAVEHVLRVGTAVGGTLADTFTEFDRKSYFYPDIPKGYQISQYAYPLVSGGELAGVALTRIHLEEDTARSAHGQGKSLVDFNRAGVPLMELVTEPVIHAPEDAGRFARELQLLLRTLGVGNANLEKGEMRIEANISVSSDPQSMGTKVEVKNLNSFRSVERAIAHEQQRQEALIAAGQKVTQETRGWDENTLTTFSQRVKEGSADYRYFPEPDLPKLSLEKVPGCNADAISKSLPELPWEKQKRYKETLGLPSETAHYFVSSPQYGAFFDALCELLPNTESVRLAANYLSVDVAGILGDGAAFPATFVPEAFAKLITMTREATLSSRGAKDVLAVLIEQGGDPEQIADAKGLKQLHDQAALSGFVETVLAREEKAVAEYRAGKVSAIQYLVGQAMRESRGAGNPNAFKELFEEKLG